MPKKGERFMNNKLRIILIAVLCVTVFASLLLTSACNENQSEYYTVAFDTDGGLPIASISVKRNNEIGTLPTASKDGCTFSGWSCEKDGNVNVDEHYVVTKDVTLYAVYDVETFCTVSYSTSGTAVSNGKVRKGGTIGTLPFTDKRGYAFSGWFFDKDLTKPVYTEDIIEEDVTLYAGFEKQDVDSVLPEYTELSISSDDVAYKLKFECDESIDERNLNEFISVTALYGDVPKISVILEGAKYSLIPVGGYKNGGVYKIALVDDRVNFVDLEAAHGGDYTGDDAIRTVYLSVDSEDEEDVTHKSGIIELSRSAVDFSSNENKFTVSASVAENLNIQVGSIVHITDGTGKDESYVKIKDFRQTDSGYLYTYTDCDDIDEIYEDFELNVGNVPVSNDKTLPKNQDATNAELASIVSELYGSAGTQAITSMLAGALNASPTVQSIARASASENPYRDNVSDVNSKVFTIKGLLDDLTIKATLGTAKNTNFNGIGISPIDDTPWTMLAIEFNYETDIKNKAKLEATIVITQYVFIGLAASANKSSGDFKAEITPFSQTDISFKVLVCSASEDDDDKDGDKKEEKKKDISVEIENLANGEGDASNIIQDVQEMLENKGDAIELCKVPLFSAAYTVGGVISINIDLNFVIKVSFAAGVKIDATLLEATTIGVTGNYKSKTIDCYRRSAMGSDRYIFDFYAYGYLGVKAGIEGELTVSFIGLKQVLRAGVGIEVGAYADLYGYLHYHAEERRVFKDVDTNGRHFQTLEGGVYFESGIYIELKAFVGIGKKEYGISKEFKFALLEAGDKYLYVEACDNDDLVIVFNENDDNSVSLEDLIPAEGKFMDVTTGEIETRVIPSKNIKLISNTNLFRVDGSNHSLVANSDKIQARLLYGIPSGTISLYYKGPNVLFSSAYLNENIPSLKGFKELCKVTVVYLPKGEQLDDVTDFGKEITVTHAVKSELGEVVVKTETIVAGQYYKGGIPFEVVEYCRKNGLLAEVDGNAVTFNGYTSGKHVLTKDTTFVFSTVEAQRFIAVKYKSANNFASSEDVWTVDIMAMNYNELPTILQSQKYTPANVYFEFFVVTPNGDKKVMGNEYLSKYDLYMRGTHGYKTGEVLASTTGTLEQIDLVFEAMKKGEGVFKEYSEFFTYTLEAQYLTGMLTVSFYDKYGDRGQENLKYGEIYRVPQYWINNINNNPAEKLDGWDVNGDGVADLAPDEEFTVISDMELRPVMKSNAYTITITGIDGKTSSHTVYAGSKIPDDIAAIINSDPGTLPSPGGGSFYSENTWRIVTTDFVAGDDGSAYFGNVSFKYYGDITTMPACDMTFTFEKGELYHYVTFIDESDGYYTYTDENGNEVKSKTVKIAVKDGEQISVSKDYNAKKMHYHAPDGVTKYSPSYKDKDSGASVGDFLSVTVTKPITIIQTIFVIS